MRPLIAALLLAASVSAQTEARLPPGFSLDPVETGGPFEQPVALAFAPDGRLFVAEKAGRVWIVDENGRRPGPFLDLTAEVLSNGDRGLLALALDPDFAQTGRVYLYYSVDPDGAGDFPRYDSFGRLTRYAARADDPDRVDLASRQVLLGATFGQGVPTCHFSHSGAELAFASDGTLLLSTGDGASEQGIDVGGRHPSCFGPGRFDAAEDVGALRSLRLESLAGKILRLDPETGLGLPSNPFYTGRPTDHASRVWALGLRNPFRFALGPGGSLDPADGRPGPLLIGDVGWLTWEELDVALGGEHFGWPCREGPELQPEYAAAAPSACAGAAEGEAPLTYWHHFDPFRSRPIGRTGFTAVSGAVYTGTAYPLAYRGALFYGDFVEQWLSTAPLGSDGRPTAHAPFGEGVGSVVDLAGHPLTGDLYLLDVWAGTVRRFRYDPFGDGSSGEAALAIEAFPNPTRGDFAVRLACQVRGTYRVEVFDARGRRVFGHTLRVETAGFYTVPVGVVGWGSGAYVIRAVRQESGRSATHAVVLRR